MVVCGRTFTDSMIADIQAIVSSDRSVSRRKLSQRVCEWLNWRDVKGNLKEVSCRVALLTLARCGFLKLPRPKVGPPVKRTVQRGPVPGESGPLRRTLSAIGEVELVRIASASSKASTVWDSLMDRYHYLGRGPLCGAQIRYLIRSDRHGWLGGFAFSAPAWHLEGRDRWIGWDEAARRQNLSRIVCNSRFLILPHIHVADLASHVLSLMVKRLGGDWHDRYGIEPVLLETFVDTGRFKGTCYKAANWQHVGLTKGRGRNDRSGSQHVSVKDIYVYPIKRDAQKVLCKGPPRPVLCPPVDAQDWAEEELGRVELGDHRLEARLLTITRDFWAQPKAHIPQASQTRAKAKAAYRFFDHSETTMEKILAPHYEAALHRVTKEKVVLAVQDTTTLNYNTHPATENLGPVGGFKPDGLLGLLLHDTMAFNLEGTPLGVVDAQCWARDGSDFGKSKRRHQVSIEKKESYKWLKSFEKVKDAQRRCPGTMMVSVGDREADIYELFSLAKSDPVGPQLLVRAKENRKLMEEQDWLWEKVMAEGICGFQEVQIPRRGKRLGRTARLEVRFAEVTLKPPRRKSKMPPLRVWAILARENKAPANAEPLEWMLLTTIEVTSFEEAVEKLTWYTLRWGIEVYHRILKSGCQIEERQLGSADRIETCLAIDMVVAWRIHHLTKLGRETPNVPCTVFFEDAQWKALVAYKTQNPNPPPKPPTLRSATRMVASLGGFLGRKCDGEPGTQTIWIGLQRLDDMTFMYKVCRPPSQAPPVSRTTGYG